MTENVPLSRVLAVDDDPDVAELLEIALSVVGGFDARICLDAPAARAACRSWHPELVLVDVRLGTDDGLALGAELVAAVTTAAGRAPGLVALSGRVDSETRARASAAGAREILAKPFDPMTLAAVLTAIHASC